MLESVDLVVELEIAGEAEQPAVVDTRVLLKLKLGDTMCWETVDTTKYAGNKAMAVD